jgi:hypothetical protein
VNDLPLIVQNLTPGRHSTLFRRQDGSKSISALKYDGMFSAGLRLLRNMLLEQFGGLETMACDVCDLSACYLPNDLFVLDGSGDGCTSFMINAVSIPTE